jgi:PIN domain nuclease of toxin-antitoxin system
MTGQHLVLDTHVILWLFDGNETLPLKSRELIKQTTREHFLFIPAISIWEIALLNEKNRIKLSMPPHLWVANILSRPYVKLAPLSFEISIESCQLPGSFHPDPADRMIVATSRIMDIPLMTRDQRIIDYGSLEFVKVIAC